MEIRDRYHDHIPVYTDGSRDGNYVACATVFPSNTVISMILLDLASIFTAEIWAIIKALEEKQISCFYRLTFVSPRFTVYEARTSLECVFLNVAKKHIICCWVSCHICIRGNERADSAARSALDLPHAKVGRPYNDFKHCISQYILSTCQDHWNGQAANKLNFVKPVLGDWQSSYRRCRKNEFVLYRTRIGISCQNLRKRLYKLRHHFRLSGHRLLRSGQSV